SELASLDAQLAETGGRLCCVTGSGGVGKTWLAVRWSNANADRFPDGQLYLNLRGFDPVADPMPVQAALRSLLEAVGMPATELPRGTDDLAALFRSVTNDRALLV